MVVCEEREARTFFVSVKQNTTVAVAKITGERGWRVGEKSVFASFLADQKIASWWKKCVLGHPIARATSYCLLPDTL